MKETGLMFKSPLVRAILSGQKTQTRRVMNPQPASCTHDAWPTKWVGEGCEWHCAICGNGNRLNPRVKSCVSGINCPMGKPGDRIYVRETFARVPTVCGSEELVFAADYQDGSDKSAGVKYTPAIHMPKADARIWLEITGVRVERLQSITEADAKAEGAVLKNSPAAHLTSYRRGFQELWESTGGDWPANPWVWVIDFKTISTTGRPA